MTKKEITQKLTDTQIILYIDYLEAYNSSHYTRETKEKLLEQAKDYIFTVSFAARQLGITLPPLDQVCSMAIHKFRAQSA